MTKVSFNQIDKYLKSNKLDAISRFFGDGESGLEVEVKRSISIEEMDSFIESVADAVFVDGTYKPALREFVFFKAILAYFTNIKTEGMNNERLMGLYITIRSGIVSMIDPSVYEWLITAVDERIKWTLDCALSAQKRRLDDAIAEINAEKLMISEQMDSLLTVFERMAKEAEGFNKDELMADIKKIANKSELDIARSVLYQQSEGAEHNEPAERA